MKIEKYQKGGWYVRLNNVLVGVFKQEKHADLFIKALKVEATT